MMAAQPGVQIWLGKIMLKSLRGAAGHKTHSIGEPGTITDHIARLGSTDATLETHLTTFYNSLVSAGIWEKLDVLCVPHKIEADSLLNMVGNYSAGDLVTVGSPVFTADQGFNADAFDYVETAENMDTWINYQAYDGFFMVYGDAGGALSNLMYSDDNAKLLRDSGSLMNCSIQGFTTSYTYSTYGAGFMAGSCTAQNARHHRRDTFTVDFTNNIGHTVPATKPYYGHGGLNNLLRGMAWGGGLTSTQVTDFYNAMVAYAGSRGFTL